MLLRNDVWISNPHTIARQDRLEKIVIQCSKYDPKDILVSLILILPLTESGRNAAGRLSTFRFRIDEQRRLDSIPFSNPQMSQLAPGLRSPSPLLHDRAVLEDLEFRAYRAHLLLPEEP